MSAPNSIQLLISHLDNSQRVMAADFDPADCYDTIGVKPDRGGCFQASQPDSAKTWCAKEFRYADPGSLHEQLHRSLD